LADAAGAVAALEALDPNRVARLHDLDVSASGMRVRFGAIVPNVACDAVFPAPLSVRQIR
jgi:hypothetical protein